MCTVKNLVPLSALVPFRKTAFTLAEVLITLAIIGVVAAMTMPVLIQKHRRSVVETSLKNFYTTINQAINLSVAENGDIKYWNFYRDESASSTEASIKFYNSYLKKYLNVLKIETSPTLKIFLANGSAVSIEFYGHDWVYCINSNDIKFYSTKIGKSCFMFGFYPTYSNRANSFAENNYYNKGVEPYIPGFPLQVGTDENGNPINEYITDKNIIKTNNPIVYTKLIQLNGWKIPDDYPWKF